MVSKSHDVRHRFEEGYQQLGRESLWQSLDEVDVLGHANNRDGATCGHYGCVNALSWSQDGELLLSSGDDCRLLVWKHDPLRSRSSRKLDDKGNSLNMRCVTAIRTGHTDNVFSAQLLASGSPLVATCARDRTVRVFDLERAGGTSTKDTGRGVAEAGSEAMMNLLRCHTRQVKRIVTEQSSSQFMTVSGDHTVRQHDLRSPHICPSRCPAPLVKVPHALNALTLSTLTPWYFVVAGESRYGHLFDRRMVGRNQPDEWGASNQQESDDLVSCVARFGRSSAREEGDSHPHVTGARMAQTNGHELLLSYSGDAVYQYSIYDSSDIRTTSTIVPANSTSNVTQSRRLSQRSPGLIETATSSPEVSAEDADTSESESEDEDMEGSDSDSDEQSGNDDRTAPGWRERLRQPIIQPIKDYRGAANIRTVKDVNFLGPNDEFVASGSDDGNWFLWSKKKGNLLGVWEGDGTVVNMVEGHPFLPVVAVSGIDDTVKIFEPTSGTKLKSRMSNAQRIIDENESVNTEGLGSEHSILATLQMLRAAGGLPDIDGNPECQTQ